MTENCIIDIPPALNGLIEWQAGVPVLLAQALTKIARGECASPVPCARTLDDALQRFCERLDSEHANGTHGRIAIDFRPMPATDADRVLLQTGMPGADMHRSTEIRCVAMRNARILWNHALTSIVIRRIDPGMHGEWVVRAKGQWRQCTPQGHAHLDQGWKIHVSATPNNAPRVLEACVEVLLAHRVCFKHAARLEHVESLTSSKCERGSGGKFITAYPRDPQQARRLIAELDDATREFSGPEILSDKCYRAGGVVYYRYGVFNADAVLSNDGSYESRLTAPDGSQFNDSRKAWFDPPPWVDALFPQATASSANVPPKSVLINNRYLIVRAIRHANRGGVFRAIDQSTGNAVIVKQARPHTSAELCGHDSLDALRKEAANLKLLHGLAADFIELFEQQGHLFLVQSAIEGSTLRKWIAERCETTVDAHPAWDPAELRALAIKIGEKLVAVHQLGLVSRDFTPGNLMIETDGAVRLIDPELMDQPGSFVFRYFTYGFGAPEQLGGDRFGACPGFGADAYSLGAVLFFIAMGRMPPVFLSADSARSLQMRWRICIDATRVAGFPALAQLIEALVCWNPEQRMLPDAALARMRAEGFWNATHAATPMREFATDDLAPPSIGGLLRAGDEFILERRDLKSVRLWPSGAFGGSTDECSVQHGAGGVLGYLSMISEQRRSPGTGEAVREIAGWVDANLAARATLLPGLYFGASGAALACLYAAERLGDKLLHGRAVERLCSLPVAWPNPDICHGLAGAGLALAEAWQRTGDERLLSMIHQCADQLIASVRHHDGGIHWTIAENFDSALKGVSHLGFAHGIAGIAYFLLIAGIAGGRADCVDLSVQAGHTLVGVAARGVWGARWRSSLVQPTNATYDLYYYWCSGASGIGSFLARLWHVTRIETFRAHAIQAAQSVYRIRWHSGTSGCHGIAGNGEFLLDMAQYIDPAYRRMALDMVDCLRLKTTDHKGASVIVDELETGVTVDFNTGLSGVLAFLDRLDSGGRRLWMADDILTPAGRAYA